MCSGKEYQITNITFYAKWKRNNYSTNEDHISALKGFTNTDSIVSIKYCIVMGYTPYITHYSLQI